MDPRALHDELPALVPGLLCPEPGEVSAVEAHIAEGCSRCARALVNGRDAMVTLAAAAPAVKPRTALRERIMAAARQGPLPRLARGGGDPRRFFDPAGELARLHVGNAEDAARTREVDELGIAAPPEDDRCGRFLAQLQGLLDFPLLFVSVLRGDRCGYRVQIGLDGQSRERRRTTTFCTHTVSMGAPMVVPDAASEPFFRGSNMVLREGVKSYVGVPLRTSRGVSIGNVCAMDYVPRPIGPPTVRVLELYTQPILAEIERVRRGEGDRWPSSAAGAPLHPAPWFRELVALDPDRPLLVASGPGAEALADLARPGEPVGRLSDDMVGLVPALRQLTASRLEERREELRAALEAVEAVGKGVTVTRMTPGELFR